MKSSLDYSSSESESMPLSTVVKRKKSKSCENICDSSWHNDDSHSSISNQNEEDTSVYTHDSGSELVLSDADEFERSVKEKIGSKSVNFCNDSTSEEPYTLEHSENVKGDVIENDKNKAKNKSFLVSGISGSKSKPVTLKASKKVERTSTVTKEITQRVFKIIKQDTKTNKFKFKHASQLTLLHLTYCDFCECYITVHYQIDFHLKSLCTEIQKRVCKICGIVVTAKASTSHKAFHKLNPKLKLKDFTFYDIKTNKIIQPPIPKYPKCDICEIHFTSKVDIIGHICFEVNFIKCKICDIKLSPRAYKLHINFHTHLLGNKETKTLEIDEENDSILKNETDCLESSDVTKNELSLESKISVEKVGCNVIFLCKTCNVCVSTYDDLVNHCHSHYDRVEIVLKWQECVLCKLKFESYSYKQHQESHSHGVVKEDFKIIYIDVFYFGCSNEEWIKYVFKSLSKEEESKILENSFYKLECRIKMEISQHGSLDLTMYRCEKCRCFVDSAFIYKHVQNCVAKYSINPCKFCGINLTSAVICKEHEEIVHKVAGITLRSYRIISFNRREHKVLNDAIANKNNSYVLYKCRNCNGIVDDRKLNHQCYFGELKKCMDCGLLLYEANYDQHVSKHKIFDSFKESNMKVILFGKGTNQVHNNTLQCSFSGIVYDYTFYKCIKCEICVRSVRPSSKHFCLIDAAKLKCPRCSLVFDEGKLKYHIKQHETDPDFVRQNMLVIDFDPENPNKCLETEEAAGMKTESDDKIISDVNTDKKVIEKTDTILKCECGLHHLTKSSYREHNSKSKCNSKKKVLRQKCFKCGLDFTPNVLFKHLLLHHGDINVVYKLNVVQV